MPSAQAVVFMDLLGFADLTEGSPLPAHAFADTFDIESLKALRRDMVMKKTVWLDAFGGELMVAFRLFHHIVDSSRTAGVVTKPLTLLSFSDSACLVTESKFDIFRLVTHLMREFVRNLLPVRMGVGVGDFIPVRFRADWSLAEGTYGSQFVGTGLVRAYAAEHNGGKGLRIFLHPSTHDFITQGWIGAIPYLELPTHEQSEYADYELNYLTGVVSKDQELWEHVRIMHSHAPAKAQAHYTSTIAAIDRMRVKLGQPAFKKSV
jgi:hypothetical protein